MSLRLDRDCWPKSGTLVESLPKDLNDLWAGFEDQAAVFVAEALISDPPHSCIDLRGDAPRAETFLWTVGGDCVTLEENLIELIEYSARDYDKILSDAQRADVTEQIEGLDKIEGAVKAARARLSALLDDYRKLSE